MHDPSKSRSNRAGQNDSRLSIVQLLCFTLFLQSTGIAQALPTRPEKKTWISQEEVTDPGRGDVHTRSSISPEPDGRAKVGKFLAISREILVDAWQPLGQWIASGWQEFEPFRIASVLPASDSLAASFLVQGDGRGVAGGERPPTPPRRSGRSVATASSAATVPTKATGSDIPLLAGFNLVSIPNEPPNTDPSVVLSAITGQLTAAFAYDACDAADPWKLYDPADPGASDLATLDHTQGLWLDITVPTVLPVAGAQPATTQIPLCTGWNLIGYPLAQARPVPAALASIAGKYVRVFGFEAGDPADPWEVFDTAVPAWANDLQLMQQGRGYWVLVTEDTTLDYENTGTPPVVEITAPVDLGEVTAPTEVIGNVESNSLDRWTLSFRPAGEPDATFIEIGTGSVPGTGLSLGSFDPTMLLNGMYDLKLEAVDFAGQIVEDVVTVVADGQMKIGNFTLLFVDLAIKLSGLDLEVVRTYDSRDKQRRDFGIGWTLDLRRGSYRNNIKPGDGWQIVAGGPLPCQSSLETKPHLTTIRLSDQELYQFRLDLERPAVVLGGCFAEATFKFVDGPLGAGDPTLEILGNRDVIFQNGGNEVIDSDTLEIYEPGQVRLRTGDGRVFDLDLEDGVTRIQDLNANELTISSTGISHSSGVSATFVRDADDRIVSITDPLNQSIAYEYDAAGDLVTVTDRDAASSGYTYNDRHDVLKIDGPDGTGAIRNEYDSDGRLARHIDAFGNVLEYKHELADRQEIVTDREGHSRLFEYDERGNVIREVNQLGAEILRVFDTKSNLLSETNPLGHTTSYAYNADGNRTEIMDSLGNKTTFTYNERGQILTEQDPKGGLTTSVFDAAGNLLSTTNALGATTTFTYDANGNLLSQTEPLGAVTRFEYDGMGNILKEINTLGHETQSAYDANGNRVSRSTTRTTSTGVENLTWTFKYDATGRLLETVEPDGSRSFNTYDVRGSLVALQDSLGRITTFSYDDLNRPTGTIFPDGSTELQTYDKEGRQLTMVDRGGRTTTNVYDAAGRQVQRTFSDGTSTQTVYDAAGRVVEVIDPRGNATRFEFDAADRRTRVIDALGNSVSFAYDSSGNQISQTDPAGRTTQFEYDALDRLTRTIFADGTDQETVYDVLGRKVSESDQAGNTTHFTYDLLGQLLSVTDEMGSATTYTYDELGNRISHRDANGHETLLEFDNRGRLERKVLPDGAAASFTHDSEGNLLSQTDFAGAQATFSYDAADRLILESFAGGATNAYSYSPTGQRAQVVGSTGTIQYEYDGRDRLVQLTSPTGQLRYSYDAIGNRTSLTAEVGAATLTTSYTYDALNRLSMVTDPQGGSYSYGYDASGNRSDLVYPNGTTTEYAYDILNRLVNQTTTDNTGSVINSFAYTLGSAGNRERVDEHDGTSRSYTYDALYRLTSEVISSQSGDSVSRSFEYDSVGNRLRQILTEVAGPAIQTDYTYNERDQLLLSGSSVQSWDPNGNLTARDGSSFSWNSRDRLTSAALDDGTTVSYRYDADGNRERTEVTEPSGDSSFRQLLIDPRHILSAAVSEDPVSQAVVEIDGSGSVSAYYVRGDDLLAVVRPSNTRYFHADGLGSIRTLTDETGMVTDRYTFSAFGELLEHDGVDENAYLFAGQAFDFNSGFYYLRARWMNPQDGRFLSMDPFPGMAFEPSTLHKYTYTLNNPVNRVDPSGLFSFASAVTVVAIVGQVLSAFMVGWNIGTMIRLARRGELTYIRFLRGLAEIALAFIPGKLLSTLAKSNTLRVARLLEGFGFKVRPVAWDLVPTALQGGKTGGVFFHFVRRMFERGISVRDILRSVRKGKLFYDTKLGSYIHFLPVQGGKGVAVIVKDGALATAYKTKKLGKRFVEVAF